LADVTPEQFPRAALNPAAAAWQRAVESRIIAGEAERERLLQRILSQGRFVSGMKGSEFADGSIYRPNGIVAVGGDIDFTVFRGVDETDENTYASLNLQPGYSALRVQNNEQWSYPDGILRLGPRTMQIGWGDISPHDFNATNDDDEIPLESTALYFQYEGFANPGHRRLELGGGMLIAFSIGDWIQGKVTVDEASGKVSRKLVFFGGASQIGDDGSGIGGGGDVPDASTTTKGKVELATVPEAVAGTDATRAVTPAGVKAALATVKGLADHWRGDWVQP
jgi:hypothetical protein